MAGHSILLGAALYQLGVCSAELSSHKEQIISLSSCSWRLLDMGSCWGAQSASITFSQNFDGDELYFSEDLSCFVYKC